MMIKKYSRELHQYWTWSNSLKLCQGILRPEIGETFPVSKYSEALELIACFPQRFYKEIKIVQ